MTSGESHEKLETVDARKVRIVVRVVLFFFGMTIDESAEAKGLSASTVNREEFARIWMLRQISQTE